MIGCCVITTLDLICCQQLFTKDVMTLVPQSHWLRSEIMCLEDFRAKIGEVFIFLFSYAIIIACIAG